jgi:branched-chain amino acid transport system substrate-binding protein
MNKLTMIFGALLLMSSGSVNADGHKVKVGMITTLSGGGSGLGIDVRDGFMLAVKNNKNISVIIKDDQRKPDIAVQ